MQLNLVTSDEEDGPGYVEIANEAQLKAKRDDLVRRLEQLVAHYGLNSREMVLSTITVIAQVELRSFEEFQRHWIDEIVASKGFKEYEEPRPSEGDWYLNNGPFGWLTLRHSGALEAHGYSHRFAFWAQELGHSRGHLWIQTDRGPLRLTDGTDLTWSRSVFPVQVSTIHGEPLFELEEEDVSDDLMRAAPRVPKALTKGLFGLIVDVVKR